MPARHVTYLFPVSKYFVSINKCRDVFQLHVTVSPSRGLFTCMVLQGSLTAARLMTLSFPLVDGGLSGEAEGWAGAIDVTFPLPLQILNPAGLGTLLSFQLRLRCFAGWGEIWELFWIKEGISVMILKTSLFHCGHQPLHFSFPISPSSVIGRVRVHPRAPLC